MPLDPRADEDYYRIPPPPGVEFLQKEIDRLRKGLRQIVEGDYPSDAGNAETWAREILHDSGCVNWTNDEENDGPSGDGKGAG